MMKKTWCQVIKVKRAYAVCLMLGLMLWFQGFSYASKILIVDIRGLVTCITVSCKDSNKVSTLGFIRVEGKQGPDTQFDKADIRITTACKIQRAQGNLRKAVNFAEIKQGDTVEATFAGPVAESYPVQATAQAITILDKD